MGEFALGQPVPRFEDPRLIRGGGRYADDIRLCLRVRRAAGSLLAKGGVGFVRKL